MTDFNKECLNALLNKEKFDEFMRTQLEEGLDQLLESELTAFLGYDPYAREGWNSGNSRNGSYFRQVKVKTQFGPIKVQVSQDRKGKFHQHTLPAYGQHTDTLESTVIQLYSHGVTTREISDLIEKMYGSYYSAGTVSNISKQVETFLSDGFVGIKDMLKQYYLKSKFQRCLVHVMRNIKGKVRVSDRKEALDDFKQVHKQSSLKEAETVLHASYDKYDSKYSSMIKNLQKIEEDLLVFYQYPKQIRPSIYSTNMIESINNMIKRKTKPKSEFPTEESLDNFLGVQAIGYNDRNSNRTHKGFGQVTDTLESYFD